MYKKVDINYDWKYKADFKEEYIKTSIDESSFSNVNIPHSNIELPYNNFDEKDYQFESCYRKDIWVDDFSNENRLYLHFKAVMAYAKVYVNEKLVGEHKGGYTPFKFDISEYVVKEANNSVVVLVDSHERDDIPPFGFVIDYLTYGGIYREVLLEYANEVNIDNMNIKTKKVLSDKPEMDVDFYINNASKLSGKYKVNFRLVRNDNKIIEFTKNISLSGKLNEKFNVKQVLKKVNLWDIETPNLYFLEADIILDEEVLDSTSVRFGFRDAIFKSDGFYLNGKKIKIRGLNRHQSYPYVGYAMPKSAQYKDADILKYELGVNTVRLSHYPQSDHFMDRCDELGLLVFDEIPGWQHIGGESWKEVVLANVDEMIKKDWNHPSVIIWGTRINESSDDNELYKKTHRLAKMLDDSRNTGGVRYLKNSKLYEDVYTYNDFVHTGDNVALEDPSRVFKGKAPYLVTEHNGHMFPTKKFDDESHRVDHAVRHLNVLDTMYGNERISGAIGWCMFDYNTHKDFGSGDKICYHGVMDMFRIPKYASYVYASQQNEKPVMHVLSPMCIGEYASSSIKDVYVFTNCDYVKLYKNDVFIKTFYPRKDKYKNVPNAPVLIDDFLGNLIHDNEKYQPKDADLIKELLTKASQTGGKLSVIDNLRMGKLFLKYKMTYKDGADLYTKYFGGWGGASTNYKFEGYKNDECVKVVTKGQVFEAKLSVSIDSEELIEEETYDVTRLTMKLLDDNDNDIYYANDALVVSTEGPIEIIGPKVISLIGGSRGLWIKSQGESGEGKVIITSERFGVIEKKIQVKVNKS